MSGLEVILLDLGVFALAAFAVGLGLYRFTKDRSKRYDLPSLDCRPPTR